jgi:membrane peptidoglycan carboxypeptidase
MNALTQDSADNWTIGYTPQLIGGVHLDRPDKQSLSLGTYGLQGAAPVWQAVMRYAHDRYGFQAAQWPQPEGVTRYVVCEKSGLVPAPDSACPTRSELFLTDVYPTREDTYWRNIEVNSQTNTLATTYTPPNLVQEQVYFIPPESAMDWWTGNNLPLPPETYDLSVPDELSAVEITSPQSWTQVGGEVEIFGTIDTDGMQSYQLSYGEDAFNPSQWFEISGSQTDYTPGQPLATWDTSSLDDGTYTLQLSVTYSNNRRDADYVVGVTVDNTPPTVDLQTGEGDDGDDQILYRWPAEDTIPLRALVDDNLGIERVEFYHNGILLGTATEWPYGFEFDIERAGIEVFRVIAYDRVGNSAADDVQVDVIRSAGGADR